MRFLLVCALFVMATLAQTRPRLAETFSAQVTRFETLNGQTSSGKGSWDRQFAAHGKEAIHLTTSAGFNYDWQIKRYDEKAIFTLHQSSNNAWYCNKTAARSTMPALWEVLKKMDWLKNSTHHGKHWDTWSYTDAFNATYELTVGQKTPDVPHVFEYSVPAYKYYYEFHDWKPKPNFPNGTFDLPTQCS